jgi:hypothetical protein
VPLAERAGIVSTCPSESKFGSEMLLLRTISSTLTPNRLAIPDSVSPALTVYVVGAAVGAASGVDVGVSTGVITSLTFSSLPGAPLSHPASSTSITKKQAMYPGVRVALPPRTEKAVFNRGTPF